MGDRRLLWLATPPHLLCLRVSEPASLRGCHLASGGKLSWADLCLGISLLTVPLGSAHGEHAYSPCGRLNFSPCRQIFYQFLKRAFQWHCTFTMLCNHYCFCFQKFSLFQIEAPRPLTVTPHSLLPALGDLSPTFYLHEFAHCRFLL